MFYSIEIYFQNIKIIQIFVYRKTLILKIMSNTKKLLENCESCNRPFPTGTLTTDGLCSDCEEYWFDHAETWKKADVLIAKMEFETFK